MPVYNGYLADLKQIIGAVKYGINLFCCCAMEVSCTRIGNKIGPALTI